MEDFWRLQNEMNNVYATQAEHTDRISRLEKRSADDSRMRSAWGSQSPFPGITNGVLQQGTRLGSHKGATANSPV